MTGLLAALQVGAQGLQAHQFGAQITGTNIANATLPGYHREDPWLTTGAYTTGDEIAAVRRAGQAFLEQNVATQIGNTEQSWARSQQLVPLQNSVADITAQGLGTKLTDLFNSLRNMAASPSDLAVRTDVLSKLQNLSSSVSSSAANLYNQRLALDAQIVTNVSNANTQIGIIADLNVAISVAQTAGNPACDLQDQRDNAVDALAKITGARVDLDDNGNYIVSLGQGITVVRQGTALYLDTAANANDGLSDVVLANTSLGALEGRLSGSIGGLAQVRDVDIVAAQDLLDNFAFDTATALNTVHTGGYDLNGLPGTDLFVPPAAVSGAAMALQLSNTIVGAPAALAAALSGTAITPVPGDNRNAVLLAATQNSLVASAASQTLSEALGSMVSQVGNSKQFADAFYTEQKYLLTQANNLREQESGVNVEDQMIHLTQYQTAHAATAKFIAVIDDMLTTLLQL